MGAWAESGGRRQGPGRACRGGVAASGSGRSGYGKIDLTVTGDSGTTTDLIADVAGYYTTGHGAGTTVYVPVAPARIYDTGQHTNGAIQPGGYLHLVFNTAPTAYVLNITEVSPTAGGYLTAYPDATQDDITSTMNFPTGKTRGGYDQATVSASGLDIQNNTAGTVQIITDEFGYFATN